MIVWLGRYHPIDNSTKRLFKTLVPPSTPDEARAMTFAGVHAAGGSQASQDLALHLGVAADGIGLSVAGPRAGPAMAFLGAQTGARYPAAVEQWSVTS